MQKNNVDFRLAKTFGVLLGFLFVSPANAALVTTSYSEESHKIVSVLYCLNYVVESDNSGGTIFYRDKLEKLSKSMATNDLADGVQLYFISANDLVKKHGIRITDYNKKECDDEERHFQSLERK